MDSPLISIVVCTYNGERFLDEQLQSVISQTYQNLEIIISDDHSTDATITILKKYENLKNVSIIYKEKNVGFTKNFESAASLAKGRYIAFSDQDDIWLNSKIEKLYNTISNYSLVYSNSILIDDKGMSLNKCLSDFRKMKDIIKDSRGFAFHNVVSGHTMMIDRELLPYAFPIPEKFYHDWWIAIQAANINGIIFLNEPLTFYRQHTDTVTKTIVDKTVGSRKREKRHQDYLQDLKWLELFKNNKIEKNKLFYNQLYDLYLLKARQRFVWPLFFFLLRNENVIFKFFKKSYLSKLIEIRKMARGERMG